MADPISFIASLVAIWEFAEKGPKIVNIIYKIAHKSGELEEDIEGFGAQISNFSSLTQHFRTTIENLPKNITFRVLQDEQFSKDLNLRGKITMKKVKAMRDKLKKRFPKDQTFFSHLKLLFWWYVWKPEVELLDRTMQSVTCHLILLSSLLEMDQRIQSPMTPENEERIKQLRRQIRTFEKTIRHHEELLKALVRKIPDADDGARISETFAAENRILEMSQDLTSDIPRSNLGNLSSSGTSPSDDISSIGSISLISATSNLYSSISSPHVVSPLPTIIPDSRQRRRKTSSQRHRGKHIPISHAIITSNSSVSNNENENENGNGVPVPEGESTYIGIRPIDKVIKISKADDTRAGYINNDRRLGQVRGFIHGKLNLNIMSLQSVEYYNLSLQELDPDLEPPIFDFGSGDRRKCLGEVKFRWVETRAEHWCSFSVRCYVYDQVPRPVASHLIFGKPFLERERQVMEQ